MDICMDYDLNLMWMGGWMIDDKQINKQIIKVANRNIKMPIRIVKP